MDSELEVIRDQMEETRASLADKLETLESQVRETVQTAADTVQSARETVTSTVENVKETVEATVENVKETAESVAHAFDPRPYFRDHPWASVGTAVGVGFVGGLLTGGSSSSFGGGRTWPSSLTNAAEPAPSPAPSHASSYQGSGHSEGVLSNLLSSSGPFGEVVDKLKGLAIGTLLGYVREMAANSLPDMWKNDVTGMLDNITTQLGGKVIHHPDLVCKGPDHSSPQQQDDRREFSSRADHLGRGDM